MSLRAVVSRRFWRSSLRAGPRPSRAVSSAAWSALDAIETLDKLRVLTFMNALAGQLDPKTIEAADFDDADDAYDVAFPLNAVGCHGLVKHILSGGRLNAKSLSKIMREACKALLADPMVQELHISRGGRCVVVGDLHGSIADLGAALAVVGTPAAGTNCVVFNGDFVDRGDDGCEVLAVVLAMRLSFPGAVHLNRGNHEDAALSRVYDFANELAIKYGPAQADALLGDADAAFAAMPLAAVVDGHTLVIHGGVPRAKPTLHDLAAAPRLRSVATAPLGTAAERLVRDALWSDPDTRGHVSGDGVDNLARGGAGCVMSDDAVSDWLETQGLKRLVRSHEAAATGAEKTEMRHGKERWTIFSCSHYPNGEGLNKAAVLVLHGDGACVSWKPFPPSSTATGRLRLGAGRSKRPLVTTSSASRAGCARRFDATAPPSAPSSCLAAISSTCRTWPTVSRAPSVRRPLWIGCRSCCHRSSRGAGAHCRTRSADDRLKTGPRRCSAPPRGPRRPGRSAARRAWGLRRSTRSSTRSTRTATALCPTTSSTAPSCGPTPRCLSSRGPSTRTRLCGCSTPTRPAPSIAQSSTARSPSPLAPPLHSICIACAAPCGTAPRTFNVFPWVTATSYGHSGTASYFEKGARTLRKRVVNEVPRHCFES
ncbi:Metallo-dependent phosphatase-like protein [Pelagophyceae sp. CCMP2097]|nr:Metallo-dependent phosphatase-like protein [Pelagophyceae sp. CCMP2097]